MSAPERQADRDVQWCREDGLAFVLSGSAALDRLEEALSDGPTIGARLDPTVSRLVSKNLFQLCQLRAVEAIQDRFHKLKRVILLEGRLGRRDAWKYQIELA